MGVRTSFALTPLRHSGTLALGQSPLWDHGGPRRMGVGPSFALGSPRPPTEIGAGALLGCKPPRPPPHRCGGLRHIGVQAFSTLESLRPLPIGLGGIFCFGTSMAHVAMGPPRCASHERGRLFLFRIIEALAAWAWGSPSLWDYQGPRHLCAGAFAALGSSRPPPHGCVGVLLLWDHRGSRQNRCGGLIRFRTTEASAAFVRGPLLRGPPSPCNH